MSLPITPELSICIATYCRATFIGATLDSIVTQLVPGVELIVVDGNSSDQTPVIVQSFCDRYPQISYHREACNSGVDADYDKAVAYARGRYCWLMTDDDLLLPGAIATILSRIAADPELDLVVVNAEVRNIDFSELLQARLLAFSEDRRYGQGNAELFFSDVARHLKFIGGVIVRRSVWMQRDRSSYFGTLFIHVGTIFQSPPISPAYVIAKPLVSIRYGNAMWTSRGFEIWMFLWPRLIWSFAGFSNQSKATVSAREPWRQITKLGMHRATGGYSLIEYRHFFAGKFPWSQRCVPWLMAIIPARLANALASVYCVLLFKSARLNMYDLVRSRYASWATRLAAKIVGV